MSNLYYLAFIIGFSTAAFSNFDLVKLHAQNYQTEMRTINEPVPLETCDKRLSANFCHWVK